MNFRNPTVAIIVVSLIAAIGILAASAIFEGTGQTITFIIIAIWWVAFSMLMARKNEK